MRTIIDIYKYYKVPRNLQLHMLRVAGAAELIIKNWNGSILNRDKIIRVLLLHDVGNIVKSNFENRTNILFPEENDYEYWKRMQTQFVAKYGKDDHKASYLIGKEVGLSKDELALMNAKIFINNDATVKSPDYHLKISAYVDQRVAPTGILPLLDRLNEAKQRYKDIPGSSMNNPRTEMLIQCALEIEKQVLAKCSITAEDINNSTVEPEIQKLTEVAF